MKKVMSATFFLVVLGMLWNYFYFYDGSVYLPYVGKQYENVARIDKQSFLVKEGESYGALSVKGIEVGMSKPGYFPSEDGIDKETFLKWFEQIDRLGANVICIDRVGSQTFYEAFYEYNHENEAPLFLIQQVAFDDYFINSTYSANEKKLKQSFIQNCKTTIDSVHGRKKMQSESGLFADYYHYDVSPWVIGYILGGEWESTLVSYTNRSGGQRPQYEGTYLYTKDASNFEIFLAEAGDECVGYESRKYGRQTPIAFSNWTMTDPLLFEEHINLYFRKADGIDVEHIYATDSFEAGQFAAYTVNTAYPDFCRFTDTHEQNTFRQYLNMLVVHHTMPVLVNGFGFSSSRGMTAQDPQMQRNAGGMSEDQQGEAIVSAYEDIVESGCVGGILQSWQDAWYKSTWNTLAMTEENSQASWLDVQTCDQQYGLLAFDPGEHATVCYVDGEADEWTAQDLVVKQGDWELSMKYDEAYLYFMAQNKSFRFDDEVVYIPIDTTPKSGADAVEGRNFTMNRKADFVLEIDGPDRSRLYAQERYNMVNALYFKEISSQNFFSKHYPSQDTTQFSNILMLRQEEKFFERPDLVNDGRERQISFQEYDSYNPLHYRVKDSYETGKLLYGNANPASEAFCSLADFCEKYGVIEIRLPWALLNFSDPTRMLIHDDYYDCLGVESIAINQIYAGVGQESDEIDMQSFALKPLGKSPNYHERLKASYEIVLNKWKEY